MYWLKVHNAHATTYDTNVASLSEYDNVTADESQECFNEVWKDPLVFFISIYEKWFSDTDLPVEINGTLSFC